SSRPWSRCSRRSRRGCRSTPATCSSPRHLGRPLQACPCGLLPSRFSYRHSAWRARGYVPMSDGTRRDGQACASHPPPKTVRRVAGLGLTHTAVQQTVVDVNSGPRAEVGVQRIFRCSHGLCNTAMLGFLSFSLGCSRGYLLGQAVVVGAHSMTSKTSSVTTEQS